MQNRPLNPNQLTAARLLLYGHQTRDIAEFLHLHPYTISRWKKDPRFQAELRRQIDCAARHTAQQCATDFAPARNEANIEATDNAPLTTDDNSLDTPHPPAILTHSLVIPKEPPRCPA